MRPLTLQRDLLLGLTGLLLVAGLVLLASASNVVGFQRFGDSYFYFKHQLLFGVLPGIILFVIAKRLPLAFWRKISPWFYLAILVLLVVVLLPGIRGIGNTKSWIVLGAFSFQPAEIGKFALILVLAWWGEVKRDLGSFLLILLPVVVLLALQPDIGTLFVLVGIALVMYYLAGGKLTHLAILFLLALAALALLVFAAPYRLDRLAVFWNDQYDPQGAGYHVRQALIAIGSGGLWGRGLGHSRQKFQYLPEVQSDSLFAVAAEELGFIFTAIFLVVLVVFWRSMLKLALLRDDRFSRVAIGGILAWFVLQTFLNLGAMVGVLPLTGVPLPLISYGGTALATELAAIGFVMGVTRTR